MNYLNVTPVNPPKHLTLQIYFKIHHHQNNQQIIISSNNNFPYILHT